MRATVQLEVRVIVRIVERLTVRVVVGTIVQLAASWPALQIVTWVHLADLSR